MTDFQAQRAKTEAHAKRVKKLTYVGIGIGGALGFIAIHLPTNFQWFLGGVIVGLALAFGLLLSNLFWKGK